MKIKKSIIITSLTILILPLVLILSSNNYSGPVIFKSSSFKANIDFPYSPKSMELEFKASDEDLKKIGENTTIKLQNSISDLGYPMASYKITGQKIIFKLPILEPGYYSLYYGDSSIPFSVGVGKIIVPKKATDCLEKEKESRCLSIYFREKALIDKSAKPALDELFKLTEDVPRTLYLCHNYSHSIGQITAFIYKDYDGAIKDGFDVCHFGYYHGVMESFSSIFSTEKLKEYFPVLCDKYAIGMNRGDCTHGLGHITWWRTGGEFMDAVEICKLAGEKITIGFFRDMDSCVTGVAMEWSNAYLAAEESDKKIMTEGLSDPAYICKKIEDDKLASGCWEFIGPVWGGNDKNIEHMLKICQELRGIESQGCWLGLGRDNAFRPEVTSESAVKTCMRATDPMAMWLCQSNVVHSKTVTTRLPGTAKLVCSLVPKSTINYLYQCQGLQTLENERLNAEGRNQLTGEREKNSTYIGEASGSQK